MRKKLVILSGAGMSAESGIPTFRDMGGMWEKYDVTEVASPQAWKQNPQLVLDFYNQRRKKLLESHPNKGHIIISELEKYFDVYVVTQNVDDLHERAGSSNILHLHGELRKVRSTKYPNLIYELPGWELKLGDLCDKGAQLRPHIVWFGESVDKITDAQQIVKVADILVVVGTSLNVYPAAGLVHFAPKNIPIYVIDPTKPTLVSENNITFITEKASVGLEKLKEMLIT
ncbi:MAG: NAD-dependent deacylase [Marinilabiliaceae bacterium]|nr:NAD-dependent deacylase [Marinilabiliaceae bacterium]